ncbi:MAG TPA: hypothetical protein VL098_11785 [Flavipsychrobacter sp.]|nr:hypothetical protein [Flavipsychrobacter sp.]
MDVAKYIGLFLVKNNFVYIHGLGNLELKKKSSKHTGDSLTAPSYEIVMTQLGSIDDNLANFIATNEQISISKASNSLREFSMQARADMHKGQQIEIPGVGKFAEERGKTIFIADPNFTHTPPPIPAVRYARRTEEPIKSPVNTINAPLPDAPSYDLPSYRQDESGSNINWGKIGMWGAALVIAGTLAFFGIRYMQNNNATTDTPLLVTPEKDTMTDEAIVATPPVTDTAIMTADSTIPAAAPAVTNAGGMLSFDVVLNTYDNMDKAQKRAAKLISYGNNVTMRSSADSSAFYVVMSVTNVPAADTTRVLDSLRRNFNPNGVSIWK